MAHANVSSSSCGQPVKRGRDAVYSFFSSAQTDTRHRILLHTDTLRRRFDADFINESLVFEVHVRMLGAYARLNLHLTISSSTRSSCESEKKITT